MLESTERLGFLRALWYDDCDRVIFMKGVREYVKWCEMNTYYI